MEHTANVMMTARRPDEGPRDKPLYLHLIEASFAELAELDTAVNRLALCLRPVSADADAKATLETVEAAPRCRTELEGQLSIVLETLARIRRFVESVTEAVQL